jgi:hypothetical protein
MINNGFIGNKERPPRALLHAEQTSRFRAATLRALSCVVLFLGFHSAFLVSAIGQQGTNNLQQVKSRLEVQKLKLEIGQLQSNLREQGYGEGLLAVLVAFSVGIASTAASVWAARRTRLGALDQSVHDARLKSYPKLVNAAAPLAIYFPDGDSSEVSISPKSCAEMGRAMSEWYFKYGGLLLSTKARTAYFRLARALTRASLAQDLSVCVFPRDSELISLEKVDKYRTALAKKLDLKDVENWTFGPVSPGDETPAQRFKDFVFLQWLSSDLRTKLSKDLRSRRGPA